MKNDMSYLNPAYQTTDAQEREYAAGDDFGRAAAKYQVKIGGSLKFIDHYPLNAPWTAAWSREFSAGFRDGWEDILRSWTRAARR